jgi:hypothetical protein
MKEEKLTQKYHFTRDIVIIGVERAQTHITNILTALTLRKQLSHLEYDYTFSVKDFPREVKKSFHLIKQIIGM